MDLGKFLKRFGIHKPVVLTEDSSQFISRTSREFGLYTLYSRAIPLISDGLKPSQRIPLWLIRNSAEEIKTSSLAGDMIKSELYMHGDAAASDTIGLMAAPYRNNYPYLDGDGQFGSRGAPVEGIGAPRYTSVKRSKFAQAVIYPDLDLAPLVENYDGSVRWPGTFLPLLPLVLLNGIKGVATGYSTNILPRRFEDLIEAVQAVLKGKPITRLMPYWDRYDLTVELSGVPNKYIVTGRLNRHNTSTVRVTELPPDFTLEQFKERLLELEGKDRIEGFVDSTTDNISVDVKFTRATLEGMTDSALLDLLRVRQSTTERIVVIDYDGNVAQYDTAESVVAEFVKWRLEFYLTRYQNLAAKTVQEQLFWLCLLACLDADLPKFLKNIEDRSGLNRKINDIVIHAGLPVQINILDRLSSLPSYRWTQAGKEEAKQHISDCEARLSEYEAIIASPAKRKAIYLDEVSDLRKL